MKGENTLYHKRVRDILGKPFTSIVSRYLGVSIAIGIVTGDRGFSLDYRPDPYFTDNYLSFYG